MRRHVKKPLAHAKALEQKTGGAKPETVFKKLMQKAERGETSWLAKVFDCQTSKLLNDPFWTCALCTSIKNLHLFAWALSTCRDILVKGSYIDEVKMLDLLLGTLGYLSQVRNGPLQLFLAKPTVAEATRLIGTSRFETWPLAMCIAEIESSTLDIDQMSFLRLAERLRFVLERPKLFETSGFVARMDAKLGKEKRADFWQYFLTCMSKVTDVSTLDTYIMSLDQAIKLPLFKRHKKDCAREHPAAAGTLHLQPMTQFQLGDCNLEAGFGVWCTASGKTLGGWFNAYVSKDDRLMSKVPIGYHFCIVRDATVLVGVTGAEPLRLDDVVVLKSKTMGIGQIIMSTSPEPSLGKDEEALRRHVNWLLYSNDLPFIAVVKMDKAEGADWCVVESPLSKIESDGLDKDWEI